MVYPDLVFRKLTVPGQWIRPLAVLGIVLFSLFAIYAETVSATAAIWWRSDTYAHGMLVIPFSLYMIWFHRNALIPLTPKMSWWGPLGMILGTIAWLVGNAVNALIVQQLALLWLIWSAILAVLGPGVMREMLFPMAYLLLAVPIGEGIIPLLMDFTAAFTVKALLITGIPVYQDGLFFSIPNGNFEVAKACSGVRYLFASIALGGLFAFLHYKSYWRRIIFIGVSIALPIVANGFRAYGIVMLAHLSDMQLAVGVDHLIYGWVFFGIVMFLLFLIGVKWREKSAAAEPTNESCETHTLEAGRYFHSSILLALALLLFLTPVMRSFLYQEVSDTAAFNVTLSAPEGRNGWRDEESVSKVWDLSFKGATDTLLHRYSQGASQVNMFIAIYNKEQQDAELINEVNQLYDHTHWTKIGSIHRRILLNNGNEVRIEQVRIKSGLQRRTIWHWYDIGGHTISNIYQGKLLQLWNRLFGTVEANAVIALMVEYPEGEGTGSEKVLETFLRDMYSSIKTPLNQLRGRHE